MIKLDSFILTKNISTKIPTNINMESAKMIMSREAKKFVDSVLVNNRLFDWKI